MKKLILTIVFALSVFISFSQVPSYVPEGGLLAWYPFSGNTNDQSGHNLNGEIVGNVYSTYDRFGNPDKAYDFDGSFGYISVPENDMIGLSTQYSISCWFYPTQITGSQRTVVSQSRNTEQTGLCINVDHLQTYHIVCDNTDYNGPHLINSDSIACLSSWYHAVITYDGITLRIYVNGHLESTMESTVDLFYNQHLLTIGSQNLIGIDDFFIGKIDDIGVWNRALYPKEIEGLYVGASATDGIIESKSNSFMIYPNPASKYLYISGASKNGSVARITNIISQSTSNIRLDDSVSKIDISDLPGGIYSITIKDKELGNLTKFITIQ